MRILIVDDMEHVLAPSVEELERAGHSVETQRRLGEAVRCLRAAFADSSASAPPFDLVLIDLELRPGLIPPDLEHYYKGLQTPNVKNAGQALGQWLWEAEGAHCRPHRPIHAYLSVLPQNHRPHPVVSRREFGEAVDAATDFLLAKYRIRPTQLPERVLLLEQRWQALRFVETRGAQA